MRLLKLLLISSIALTGTVGFAQSNQAAKAKAPAKISLTQQVKDLTETVITLQKRVAILEDLVTYSSAALYPDDTKLQAIRAGNATLLLRISKPQATDNGSTFTMTVVNPQSISYTKPDFKIRVYGKDSNGDPKAYKVAVPVENEMPELDDGTFTNIQFNVPGMKTDNFAVAYVESASYSGIAAKQD